MDASTLLEIMGVKLARKKAETKRMSRWLMAKELAVKWKQNEMKRIKRVNGLTIAVNRRIQKLVDEFLVAAEVENNDAETAKIWTEKALREVIQGMNDLNLDGNNNIITVNQAESSCNSGNAASGGIK